MFGGGLPLAFFACWACAGSERCPASPPESGALLHAPGEAPDGPANPALAVWAHLRGKYDRDRDGSIERGEYPRGERSFDYLDADQDGAVTALDFAPERDGPRDPHFTYGVGGPEVGDEAPGFRLPSIGGETIELASFRGKKPVALVFGSFT
jgi:hypothetical protein